MFSLIPKIKHNIQELTNSVLDISRKRFETEKKNKCQKSNNVEKNNYFYYSNQKNIYYTFDTKIYANNFKKLIILLSKTESLIDKLIYIGLFNQPNNQFLINLQNKLSELQSNHINDDVAKYSYDSLVNDYDVYKSNLPSDYEKKDHPYSNLKHYLLIDQKFYIPLKLRIFFYTPTNLFFKIIIIILRCIINLILPNFLRLIINEIILEPKIENLSSNKKLNFEGDLLCLIHIPYCENSLNEIIKECHCTHKQFGHCNLLKSGAQFPNSSMDEMIKNKDINFEPDQKLNEFKHNRQQIERKNNISSLFGSTELNDMVNDTKIAFQYSIINTFKNSKLLVFILPYLNLLPSQKELILKEILNTNDFNIFEYLEILKYVNYRWFLVNLLDKIDNNIDIKILIQEIIQNVFYKEKKKTQTIHENNEENFYKYIKNKTMDTEICKSLDNSFIKEQSSVFETQSNLIQFIIDDFYKKKQFSAIFTILINFEHNLIIPWPIIAQVIKNKILVKNKNFEAFITNYQSLLLNKILDNNGILSIFKFMDRMSLVEDDEYLRVIRQIFEILIDEKSNINNNFNNITSSKKRKNCVYINSKDDSFLTCYENKNILSGKKRNLFDDESFLSSIGNFDDSLQYNDQNYYNLSLIERKEKINHPKLIKEDVILVIIEKLIKMKKDDQQELKGFFGSML